MNNLVYRNRGYILAAVLGAIGGGLIVMLATKALPKIMSQMMAGMMQNMMTRMAEEGRNPMEMCQQMMANCAEAQPAQTTSERMTE